MTRTARPRAGDTTVDAFLGGALQISQPKRGYRAGIDAVLLAAAVPVADHRDERVLDAGAGVGVAGLAIARRFPRVRVTLVEREPALAALARLNVEQNDLADRVGIIQADVERPVRELGELGSKVDAFDHVLANPPYHATGRGTASAHRIKAAANAMAEGGLERWARFLATMARPGGSATMIHRAEALGEVLAAFGPRFGAVAVLPLYPRDGQPAIRVLVQGIKGSRAPLELHSGLVLHGDGNCFRDDVEAILRRGAPLAVRGSSGGAQGVSRS